MVKLQTVSSDTAVFAVEFKKPWHVFGVEVLWNTPWATSGSATRKNLHAGVNKLPVDVCDSNMSVLKTSNRDLTGIRN